MLAHVPQQRSLHWFVPASASVLAAAALACGCLLALTGRFGQPMAPLPISAAAPVGRAGVLHLVALGDSITLGLGDDRGGYAARVADSLRRDGKTVAYSNLAVSGLETAQVLAGLGAPEARRQIQAADLILLSAAGNDLSHGLRGEPGGAAESPARDEAAPSDKESPDLPAPGSAFPPAATRLRAEHNLAQILSQLRAANPHATIRLLGLYNPFDVLPADLPAARAQLRAWNDAIEAAAQPFDNVVVVPVADLFAARTDLLAGDRYHPGPKGHELIADRLLATLPDQAR
jgi:lysophospholipase L1-like esterase